MAHNYTQPYIVVGAFIVRDGNILLVKENHLPDRGKWNIPAGKLDYGEFPEKAVVREVYEETGLTFRPTAILGLHSVLRNDVPGELNTTHVLRIVYSGLADGDPTNKHGEIENGEPEIAEYRWMKPEDILAMDDSLLRYHDMKAYVRDYMKQTYYPLEMMTHFVQG